MECVYCAVRTVFMCFVSISEQTAIISLYKINWLVSGVALKHTQKKVPYVATMSVCPFVTSYQTLNSSSEFHAILYVTLYNRHSDSHT
jgi:hypothetical protein